MQEVYKATLQLRNKMRSYIDQPHDPKALALTHTVQQLTDEIEMGKKAASLENRVKELIGQLDSFKDDRVIDYRHVDELTKDSNQIRQMLKNLS